MESQLTAIEVLVRLRAMRKRVWIPGEKRNQFQELPDGAVPMGYIEELIRHILDASLVK